MTSELLQVIADDGAPSHSDAPELSDTELLHLYRTMVTTRALDDRAIKLQRQGRIGFWVPCPGQEASHIGSAYALNDEDWVFPSYRDPGICLLRGVSVLELLHQCYGNAADSGAGRQMPVHYSMKKINFVSISSPIGTQIVQAVGAAMAAKIRRDPVVAMTYFGDGATSSNDFHTGLNFAGVYQAPCVFICENNGWAISCPLEGQTASENLAIKAEAYGIPGIRVEGNDVLAVYRATLEAVERARVGGGPTMLELVTFRMGPHSSSDDAARYRDPALVEEWTRKDPLPRMRRFLEHRGLWDEDQEAELQTAIGAEIQDAVEEAEKVGPPALSTMFDDVFEQRTLAIDDQWRALRDAYEKGILNASQQGEFPL